MKTTLEIPDDIYRSLKVRAAAEGVTVTSILTAALRSALSRPADTGERPLKKREEKKIGEWLEKEAEFLETMRGPVHGRSAIEDLIGGRR